MQKSKTSGKMCFIVCFILVFSVAGVANAALPVPDIYDDFSDGKLQDRTGTDSWGRTLPEWELSGTWDASSGEARTDDGTITVPCTITTGTWKFYYRYLSAPPTSDYTRGCRFYFIKQSSGSNLFMNNPTDGHWWLDYWATAEIGGTWPRASQSYPYINMVGSCIEGSRVSGTSWHEVVFIRDDNSYVGTWLDGKFVEYSRDRNLDITDNTFFDLVGYNLAGYTLALDNVAIYDGEFLIPGAGISYDSGTITVNDYDIGLKHIAEAVNNSSIFDYEESTNTAECHADILVKSGAELQITNGTLKIDEGRKIKYEREAMIFLDGTTITSTGSSPWYWEHSGASAYGAVVLSVNKSVINNCGGFTADGMKTLYLIDSQFTNLVGDNPFSIVLRRPPNGGLLVSGCRFQGKTGNETVFLRGGDQFHQLSPIPYGMDVIDTVFEDIQFFRHYDYPYYHSPGRPGGTVSLVNVKTDTLGYNGSTYRFKYYLDLKVVDNDGNPVPGATVTITNEQDDTKYPAENMARKWEYLMVGDQISAGGEDYFTGQQGNWFKGLVDVNDHPVTTTGADGHTPLPSDTTGIIVITDKTNDDEGYNYYAYTVIASKDGKTASMSGLDIDETWYREYPNTPMKTVVCNLDTGECNVEVVTTGTISGTVTDADTSLPVEGAIVSDGTRSETTNSSGAYTIDNVPVGTYTVTASKTGYETASEINVVVTEDATTTVDFELETGDTTPPVVTLKTITVNGSVDDDTVTEVDINGVSVTVTSGAYSHEVDESSMNTITVIATNGNGKTVTRTITIK